jgi:hypothetical protein
MLKGIQINDKTFEDVRKFLEIRRNKGVKSRNADILKLRREHDKKQAEIDNLAVSLTTAQSKNSTLAVNAIIDSVEMK